MSGAITFRNLTTTALTLQDVERYGLSTDEHNGSSSSSTNFKKRFAGLRNETKSSDDREELSMKETVDVYIARFSIVTTQLRTRSKNRILRLTFSDHNDGKWAIVVPTPSGRADRLTCLGNSRKPFYGIWFAPHAFLALFSGTNYSKWMSNYPDTTPLPSLSIPGTHNSPTHHKALPSVRCQAVSISEQLSNGIRMLDIRVQIDKPHDESLDTLHLVHGIFPISLTGPKTLRRLLEEILAFLKTNPSETIILSLKREGTGSATDADLARRLMKHYLDDHNWYTAPGIPTLSQARGKIVLLRRFKVPKLFSRDHFGIDASVWADNTPNSRSNDVAIQDFYHISTTDNLETKLEFVREHCSRATAAAAAAEDSNGVGVEAFGKQQPPLFVNFLSAANFWKPWEFWPAKVAAGMSPRMVEFLCREHGVDRDLTGAAGGSSFGGLGVVVCDWVGREGDWDLVRVVVGMNVGLLLDDREDRARGGDVVDRYERGWTAG